MHGKSPQKRLSETRILAVKSEASVIPGEGNSWLSGLGKLGKLGKQVTDSIPFGGTQINSDREIDHKPRKISPQS